MSSTLTDKVFWFCLRSQPKHEHIAAAHLRLLPGLEIFCPRMKLRRMTRRGPAWFTEALFPGYLFARFDPVQSQKQVLYAQGVSGIVKFGLEPAVVPGEAIAELQVRMGGAEWAVVDSEIREGDRVCITEGVFKGLQTVVTQILSARERVRVLLEFLGQSREVDVERTQLLPQRSHVLIA